jgi:hypothetical protein
LVVSSSDREKAGVFNLIPDKRRALFEVLKEGGRLMLADQLLTDPLPEDRDARAASWAR